MEPLADRAAELRAPGVLPMRHDKTDTLIEALCILADGPSFGGGLGNTAARESAARMTELQALLRQAAAAPGSATWSPGFSRRVRRAVAPSRLLK